MKTVNGLPVYEGTDKCSLDEYSSKMATEIPKIIEEASYDDTETRKDISDIQQEQQTQNANIEKLKQEDIDIKEELEKTKKEFNDYAIHGQASGEFIHLTDSSNLECDIKIKGNVKQDGEPTLDTPVEIQVVGNNINLLHMQEKEYTSVGVNIQQKESGLLLNGTSTGSGQSLEGTYVDIGTYKAGKYIIKIHTKGNFERSGDDDFALYIREKNNTSNSYGNITGKNLESNKNSFTFELTEDKDLVIQLFINASNIIFENFEMLLKLEKGEKATSYSPYGQGSVKVTSCNKNIFNKNDEQLEINKGKYHMKGQIQTNNQYSYLLIKPIKSNTVYSYSGAILSSKSVIVYDFYKDDEYLSNINKNSANGQITVPENCNSIYVSINIEDINTFQIEIGKNITDYKQHESKSVTVPIQQEMPLGDEFDRINKKEVHNWSKYEITGNEDWRKHATTSNNAFYFEAKNIFTNAETPANNKEEATIINTHYKNYAVDTIAQNNIEGTGLAMNTAYYIGTGLDGISTLEEFKAKMQELYNAGTPVTLYYKKTEATKLDLTQEQIEALEKLDEMQTYKNITNITTDSIAILDVDYKKDLETLINQVSQAVIEGS